MMTKTTFILFFLFICVISFGQEECGTDMSTYPDTGLTPQDVNQDVTAGSFEDDTPYVIKVHFWDFTEDDNTNEQPVTEAMMLDAVAGLNRRFNHFNVFFKLDGSSFVPSSTWREIDDYNGERSAFLGFLRDNDYYISGFLNMFALEEISPINGAALFDDTQVQFFGVVIETSLFNNEQLWAHEVGHCFSLDHTFETCLSNGCIENVAREGEPNFNADVAGDQIIDTFATPEGLDPNLGDYDEDTCLYTGNHIDATGRPYSDYEPEITNYMSYSRECRDRFSAGQIAVMRAQIDHLKDHPDGILFIDNYPVSVLYEPYRGEYYLAGPATDKPPLFQHGFDYKFVDCSQAQTYNQPSDYDDISFPYGQAVLSYSNTYNQDIEHINHTAIIINQVDDTQPRKCYNNNNRKPKDGSVIHFLDGVPNANVTITAQDSLQINNPNLLPNLDPGLYNIQKNYNDGTSQEQMILKENN